MGPELLRTGQVRAVLGEPRGNGKDQSADERHAGGQPGGEAEHEHHQQAAGAGQPAGSAGEVGEPSRGRRQGDHGKHGGGHCDVAPDASVPGQPRPVGCAHLVAGVADRRHEKGPRDRPARLDGRHAPPRRRGGSGDTRNL